MKLPNFKFPILKIPTKPDVAKDAPPKKKLPLRLIVILAAVVVVVAAGLWMSKGMEQKPAVAPSGAEKTIQKAAPPSMVENVKSFFSGLFVGKPQEKKPALPGEQPGVPQEAIPGMGVAIPVRTYKVQKMDFKDELPLLGTVRGVKQVPLFFEINGVIEKIAFSEGDVVKKGDVVATLYDKDYSLRVEYATAKQQTAEKELLVAQKRSENYQRLYESGAIIKPKYEEMLLATDVAQSNVEAARKEVEVAQKEMDKAVLRAPVDGIMGRWEAEQGQFVTPNTKLAVIADITTVWIEVGVIEKDMPKIAFGQKAAITVDAFPEAEFLGEIESLSPMLDYKTRMLSCRIKAENKDSLLLPGMFAKARLFVYEKKEALVVPSAALQDLNKDNTFDAVFVVENGVANTRPIMLDYITTDYAVVSQGVKEQDEVVIESQTTLKEGQPVEVIETQEKPAIE